MASTDYKKWYAKVKYYNGDVEDILVRKIKTQEGNQFSPKHYKDFNSNILYSVKTAMNDVEGKEQRYYAYIGKLAGSVTELNQDNKRIGWPAWPSDILDEPDNTSQDERQQNAFSSITAYREKATLKKGKKKAVAEEYQKILCNYNIEKNIDEKDFSENITIDSSGPTTKKYSQYQEKLSVDRNVSVALQELKSLLNEKVQKMEEKIEERIENSSKIIEENIIGIVKEPLSQACEAVCRMEEMLSKFNSNTSNNILYVTEWLHNSQDYSECYDLIQLLLEKICNFGDRLSTSSMSSEIENKVHLGSGFYCTNAGFAAMKAAKNDCDWAAALLIGVFGEDAKLMRIYPRKEGLKKFPLGFLMLAQNLFRERLKNDNYEGDIDQMIKSLPAYLSDRALDLGGGRSTSSRAKHSKKYKYKNISQRTEKETTVADPSIVSTVTSVTSTVLQKPLVFKNKKSNFAKFQDIDSIESNNNLNIINLICTFFKIFIVLFFD
ncbi:uncharacterized protein [Linepithema humile]|uniref:uncharacterized protein isoform X3 n=1 Tax=Linepithema humile TaxID=83485 RepID=UPI00351E4321